MIKGYCGECDYGFELNSETVVANDAEYKVYITCPRCEETEEVTV